MSKVYRTANGRTIDIGALKLRNEHVRAVGNMNVNARGDRLDSANRPIDTRNAQVARQYNKQISNVQSNTVYSSKTSANASAEIPVPPEDFDNDFVRSIDEANAPVDAREPTVFSGTKKVAEVDQETSGGLAAAIAKARQVKQETLTPPGKNKDGVKRI
jgi:hypothetical protein